MANVFGKGYVGASEVISSGNDYEGIIWETFRGMRHSLSKLNMRVRPAKFDASAALTSPPAPPAADVAAHYRRAMAITEKGTSYRYMNASGWSECASNARSASQ